MTEKKGGMSDRFPNQSKSPATTIHDKDSSNFKVKNFTSETNNDNITIREELKSVQKSIALFKQDIRKVLREELFKFLNEGQQQAIGTRYK